MTDKLKELFKKAESWPPEAQDILVATGHLLEEELAGGEYHPTPEELAGIDRGIKAAEAGQFATAEEMEETWAKFRNA